MDWEEGFHRGYYFWVMELANKKWVYSIGKISEGFLTPLPGQILGAEEFDTRGAAEEAAKKQVDRDIVQHRA
jgi:hypothetical protein